MLSKIFLMFIIKIPVLAQVDMLKITFNFPNFGKINAVSQGLPHQLHTPKNLI